MLVKLSKMLIMNLTGEENLTGLALIHTGFDRYLFVTMYWKKLVP